MVTSFVERRCNLSQADLMYTSVCTRLHMLPIRSKMLTVAMMIGIISMSLVMSLGLLTRPHIAGQYDTSISLPSDGIGIYESCALDSMLQSCTQRLQTIAQAGFKVVINYDQLAATSPEITVYLDKANEVGIKIIFAISDPAFWQGNIDLRTYFSAFGQSCHCTTNAEFIAQVIALVKNHPALWGYYIGDEVPPDQHDRFVAYASRIQQLDPHHPRLLIAMGQSDPTHVAYLQPFTDSADVLGVDYYPVGDNPNGGTVQDTGNVAQAVQYVADAAKKSSAIVLQSFNWSQYPHDYPCVNYPSLCNAFPTEAQMQTMLQLTLQTSHPRLVLWYSYYNILGSDNPSQHWQDLLQAIRNANPGSPTLNNPTTLPATASSAAQGAPNPVQLLTPVLASAPPVVTPDVAQSNAPWFTQHWRLHLAILAILAAFTAGFFRTQQVRRRH